jgi:hypothetical protein
LGNIVHVHKYSDGSSFPRNSLDQPQSIEVKDHLVDRGRTHSEILLDVGLRWRYPVDL